MEPTERWTPQLASDLYDVASWGKGYFSVGDNGHVRVHPEKDPARAIDLKQLVDTLVLRGISLPILIRFADILKHRLGEIHNAFQTAIAEHRYQGGYCCVYPIKVNQQRQVVEEVLEFGKPFKFGLEAGSKPELMAVMALWCAPAPACAIWMSAAAWASITTARRPISNRASITLCRNTPTTSSITCRTCAMKSACRTPTSSPRAGGPSRL